MKIDILKLASAQIACINSSNIIHQAEKNGQMSVFGNQQVQNSQTSKFVCVIERESISGSTKFTQKNGTYSFCLERERRGDP